MPAFDLVRRFGVRVVEVPDLDDDVIFVHDHDLALVRAELDEEGRRWVSDWLLAETLAEQTLT